MLLMFRSIFMCWRCGVHYENKQRIWRQRKRAHDVG